MLLIYGGTVTKQLVLGPGDQLFPAKLPAMLHPNYNCGQAMCGVLGHNPLVKKMKVNSYPFASQYLRSSVYKVRIGSSYNIPLAIQGRGYCYTSPTTGSSSQAENLDKSSSPWVPVATECLLDNQPIGLKSF